MRVALTLARRGLGTTWPNPSVGCVIVRDEMVVGRGWTAPGGRPHAETVALATAGRRARGATAYVTLEPCSHHGQTPPCAAALAEAGVARVVYATQDPDPRVDGGGERTLRRSGVSVLAGVLEADARELNRGFIARVAKNRPFVTLKTASSLDGRIALASRKSRWITGEIARAAGHALRAQHDAVLVGAGTVRADDPLLTVRLPGLPYRPPVRIVAAGAKPVPTQRRLFRSTRAGPVWIVMPRGRSAAKVPKAVARVVLAARPNARPAPQTILAALAEAGITRLLIEGGGDIAASFIKAGLVDRIVWFRAPTSIGSEGIAAVAKLGVTVMANAVRWRRIDSRRLGDDLMETYAAQETISRSRARSERDKRQRT